MRGAACWLRWDRPERCGELVPCVKTREGLRYRGEPHRSEPFPRPDRAQHRTCHRARRSCEGNQAKRHTHAENPLIPPNPTTLRGAGRPRVRAQSLRGEKILENVGFYRKTNLLYCPIPSPAKSQILWGRNSTEGTKSDRNLPLPTSDQQKSKKNPEKQRASGGAAIRRVGPRRRGRKASRSPENTTSKASQRHIKGNSEGRRRGAGGGGGAGNLPSIQEFSAQIKLLLCSFPQKRGNRADNPGRSRPHGASTYSPLRFKSVCGEKNALEKGWGWGGGQRFSPSSFSPPYGLRLPCSSAGLSCRRLQHRLSRQAGAAAHFKVRNRLPGPDSRIKTIEAQCWWEKIEKQAVALSGYLPFWLKQILLFLFFLF